MRSATEFAGTSAYRHFWMVECGYGCGYSANRKTPPPNTNIMAADALIGRPLGLGATVLGTGAFVATLPFTVCSRSVRESARGLVVEPAWWTFKRPLGQKKDTGFMLP